MEAPQGGARPPVTITLRSARNNRRSALVAFAVGASVLLALWVYLWMAPLLIVEAIDPKPGRALWMQFVAWAAIAFVAGAGAFGITFARGRHVGAALGAWGACGIALAALHAGLMFTSGGTPTYLTALLVLGVLGVTAWGARMLGPDPEAHD